jgi:hypothetical protein
VVWQDEIATFETNTLDPILYPFDEVLISAYSWDLGIKRTTVTSLFDTLYPIQRTISKLNAKKTQLIDNYKGPVPIFSNDCDIIVKRIGNGAGEAIILNAGRNPADVVSVLNPMPLDPEMNAEKETLKNALQELAGTQEISLDMENIRSAATVIALDQLHDQRFQSQLTQIGVFIGETLEMALKFAASKPLESPPIENVPWEEVTNLLKDGFIEVQVLHNPDPANTPTLPEPDYSQVVIDRAILKILHGEAEFADIELDYTLDKARLRAQMAQKMVKLRAMGQENTETHGRLERALLGAFIEDIKTGKVVL